MGRNHGYKPHKFIIPSYGLIYNFIYIYLFIYFYICIYAFIYLFIFAPTHQILLSGTSRRLRRGARSSNEEPRGVASGNLFGQCQQQQTEQLLQSHHEVHGVELDLDPTRVGEPIFHGFKPHNFFWDLVGGAITILKNDGVRQWEG